MLDMFFIYTKWDQKWGVKKTLQYLDGEIKDYTECFKSYDNVTLEEKGRDEGKKFSSKLDHAICVDFKNGTDACQGDSGGPLYLINKKEAKKHEQEWVCFLFPFCIFAISPDK